MDQVAKFPQSEQQIRVRFAPSPTGYLHIGSLRTALFNWLFAKHNKGTFLIRIEDTDVERSKQEYTDSILKSFEWVNITSDEIIIYQTKRLDIYKRVIDKLLSENKAYKCYCSQEEIKKRLGSDVEYKKYDKLCRSCPVDVNDNRPFVIRLMIPDIDKISFDDLIKGNLVFDQDQFDDFVLVRSDGIPTYNFAVVVDDIDTKITHVLRGEDHIPNTPKQIFLYKALDAKIPRFGHFPMIMGADGTKLSKRHGATSVEDYKKNGFLASALCNYLARLGWSHGDQEVFTQEELIKYFSLDHVGKSPSIFDVKKLEWLNSVHLRNLNANEILNLIKRDVNPNFENNLKSWDNSVKLAFIDLYKERVKTIVELISEIEKIYEGPREFDKLMVTPYLNYDILRYIELIINLFNKTENFSKDNLSEEVKALAKSLGVNLSNLAIPLRIALTNTTSSPGIFDIASLIGKKESIDRLNNFKNYINLNLNV